MAATREAEQVVGTLDYAAPEQIEDGPIAAQTDVYGLGCVLYQCLVGEVPYPKDTRMQLLWAHLEEAPSAASEHNSELPPGIDAVVGRALAKEPQQRFATCGELVAEAWLALSHDVTAAELAGRTRAALPDAPVRNPYKGLLAFREEDADDFFGREAMTEELLERLARPEREPLVVVGPSGSGKSSLVRAGLLPLLRAGGIPGSASWRIVELVPGSHPSEELEAALVELVPERTADLLVALRQDERGLVRAAELALAGDESAELLLVLDQFEELFTLVDDEERRVRFLALLAATAGSESRVRVVLTLRADFYDRPLRYPGFSEFVERGTIAVHPLTGDELRRAVVEPAHRAGLSVEDGLVAEMVADVQGEPGALPLLQYALSELYERRDERTLTLESYQEIGGISGALARRADELFLSLAEDAQATVRRLFTRLVALGEGAEDTRRRVLRSEVDAIPGGEETIGEVIDAYGRHRLLAFDRDPISGGPTVEIAHEALLREWPRLRGWIDQDRDGLRLLRHLSESAAAWDRLGRDEGDLYRGARLEQSLAWTEAHPSDLNPLETEFLVARPERRDADRRAEQERIEQRIRQNRRLRVALAVIAVALLGAIVAGVLAFDQRGEANQQAERAEAERADQTAFESDPVV